MITMGKNYQVLLKQTHVNFISVLIIKGVNVGYSNEVAGL